MIRVVRGVVSGLVVGLVAGAAAGQVTEWTNPGAGDWFDPGNWSDGVPVTGDTAWVDNGGTVQISSGVTDICNHFLIGQVGASTGTLEITGGTFRSNIVTFANGMPAFGDISGAGTVVEVGALTLNSSPCTVNFADGTLNASTYLAVGWASTGIFNHMSGVITTPQVILGNLAAGTGFYDMTGGTLNADDMRIAAQGSATFTQADGVVNAGIIWIPGTTGAGEYQLQGGILNADVIRRSFSPTSYAFTFTGGQLNVGIFGQFLAMDLTCAGGEIVPGGGDVGITTVNGAFDLQAGAAYRVSTDGTPAADQIRSPQVTLAGALVLDLGAAPSLTDVFTIIDNQGVDPISGTFAGIPEGGTVTGTFGGTAYNFAVSYTGGSGNDVVIGSCFGDATGDGSIDFDDLNIVLIHWGEPGPEGDLDGSGLVDFDDLNIVLSSWGTGCV
ncbi:MAG: hypothetical protein KDA21_02185 [Phycisphaerales bacterium]|nr:hypothetical protein [Phycisphaerales bacterium]